MEFRLRTDILFEAGDIFDAFGQIAAHFIALQLEMTTDDVTAGEDWFEGVIEVGASDDPQWKEKEPQ